MSISRFPEMAIIQATTHGGTIVDQHGNPQTFKLPEGMVVAKLSAVSPGICNLITPEISLFFSQVLMANESKLIDFLNFIRKLINKFGEENVKKMFQENGYPPFINGLIEIFKEKDAQNITDIEGNMQIADEDEVAYLQNFHRFYSFGVKQGTMLNRVYQRSPQEYFGNGTASVTWDFKVSVLNVPGQPDLLQEIDYRTTRRTQQITSKQIMKYLYDNGVRTVLFADFTCFSFLMKPDTLNKEEQDALTEYLIKHDLLGGKTSRRRKKRNKNKKRKTKNTRNKRKTRKNKTTRKK